MWNFIKKYWENRIRRILVPHSCCGRMGHIDIRKGGQGIIYCPMCDEATVVEFKIEKINTMPAEDYYDAEKN